LVISEILRDRPELFELINAAIGDSSSPLLRIEARPHPIITGDRIFRRQHLDESLIPVKAIPVDSA
jgi:hypothetical protein